MVELQRGDLAQRFNCVPSQINYVMSTRFSPEHGYIVESRRGGIGYIRITRVRTDRKTLLMQVINSIGDALDYQSAKAITTNLADSGAVECGTAKILLAAISENALHAVPKELAQPCAGRHFQAGHDPRDLEKRPQDPSEFTVKSNRRYAL